MTRSSTTKKTKKAAMTLLGDDVRVAIYVRRSTDDENQPYSIDVQDTRLEAYINSQPGWRLVKRFADDASGATTDRTHLARAMAAAKAGLFDVLLVYRVDRFSRCLRDMVMLLDELDQAGVVFRSATEPFDTSTPMGRMLVQLLGMFAQFERDMIVDRVVGGMERKAAKGKWKGGRHPFGYHVDTAQQSLVINEHEAVIVRLIFNLYTSDRLGSRSIAAVLNHRGHRTATGAPWSYQQVLRALTNRVYLGELSFGDIITTDTHTPIVTTQTWAQAEAILDERGENHERRAASASDYHLTGRLRCPQCGKAMIGTRATGRNKTYRYYTCWSLARYDSTKCDFPRLNADSLDQAVLDSLASFYRDHHNLINDAINDARRHHHQAAHTDRRDELATIEAELTKTNHATERYLNAFEQGNLDPELLTERLRQLRDKTTQLRTRRDELTLALTEEPATPQPVLLAQVAAHIDKIIETGASNHRKALIEALVATSTSPDQTGSSPSSASPKPTQRTPYQHKPPQKG